MTSNETTGRPAGDRPASAQAQTGSGGAKSSGWKSGGRGSTGGGPGVRVNAHGHEPPPGFKDVVVPLARYLGSQVVDYSKQVLRVTGRRRGLPDQESLDEQATPPPEPPEPKERAPSASSPLIYIPHMMDTRADRKRQKRKRQAASAARGGRRTARNGNRSWIIWFQILLLVSLLSIPALAVQPDEKLADPGLEQRAREISLGLRCVVCQNQSIDDSNAPLARDLRILVRERLLAGDSDEEVIDFVRERYGDYVLLSPPVQSNTYVLWLAPPAVLVLGALAIGLYFRNRSRAAAQGADPAAGALSAEERAALDRVLTEAPKNG